MQRYWIDGLIIQWFLGLWIRKYSRHISSTRSGLSEPQSGFIAGDGSSHIRA
jgi:hypothetical protein